MDKAAPPQPYRPGRAVLQGLLDLRPSLGLEVAAFPVEDAVARGLAVAQVYAFASVDYPGAAGSLKDIWIAIRASLREILEGTSLQDLVDGTLPPRVLELTGNPESWVSLGRIRGAGRLVSDDDLPRPSPSPRRSVVG